MPLRRSTRERRNAISDDYIVYLQEREVESGMMEDDPINFQQAMKSSNSQKWIEAMNEEYKSMQDNKVWNLSHYQLESRYTEIVLGYFRIVTKDLYDKVLQRYGMQNSKPGDTPVAKGDKFSLNQCPKNSLESQEMQKIPYASVVGSLMYAQSSQEGYEIFTENKRVHATYRRLDQLELIGYSDSDFAGCQDSRRSTSGYIYLLAGGAISWRSAKQTLVTSSTMEAEFVAFMRHPIKEYGYEILSLGCVFWMVLKDH
ncbi:hypothetical protein CK203_104534 [Vitis vinifera]|uniref:Retrovirus-related Pol polyprotein from transposon TNT 1-94 n=1 Tax=Vitis vinifera TaxID=29760 RepID=A0A438D3N5_VITVI|nr:hypothetical protein CK203_104534 [Vitis vinifera]